MAMLKSGGSAVDAVEIAIIVLEDTEITNSGYGSNLTMEGKVECDASIVDHEGRSGAAGAVARKSLLYIQVFVWSTSSNVGCHARRQKPNLLGPCHSRRLGISNDIAPSTSKLFGGIRRYRLCI